MAVRILSGRIRRNQGFLRRFTALDVLVTVRDILVLATVHCTVMLVTVHCTVMLVTVRDILVLVTLRFAALGFVR